MRHTYSEDWADEEIELLEKIYETDLTFKEILAQLPRRTKNGVQCKAWRLKLHRPLLIVPGLCPYCGQPLKKTKRSGRE